jgi:hypothetical protein
MENSFRKFNHTATCYSFPYKIKKYPTRLVEWTAMEIQKLNENFVQALFFDRAFFPSL